MSLKTCSVSQGNYKSTIEWLEEKLTEIGATKKEILRGELLLEETFFRLVSASADAESFEGRLTIRKRFGDISISLSAKGEAFNPLVSMEEVSDDEEEMHVFSFFSQQFQRLYAGNHKILSGEAGDG